MKQACCIQSSETRLTILIKILADLRTCAKNQRQKKIAYFDSHCLCRFRVAVCKVNIISEYIR